MNNERLYGLRDTLTDEWLCEAEGDSSWSIEGEPMLLTEAEAVRQARITRRGTQIVRVRA